MDLLRDAFQNLRQNRRTLVAYVAGTVIIVLGYRLGHRSLAEFYAMDAPPPWLGVYTLFADLILGVAVSVLQAIFFAEIGKNIDRPLWKCDGPREALTRFFTPWFILNLLSLMLMNLEIRAIRQENFQFVFPLEFLTLFLYLFFIPIGACIMHARRLNWQELPETLMPIVRVYPLMLFVFLLGAGQYLCHLYLLVASPPAMIQSIPLMAIVDAAMACWDCVIFAAMWRVCMIYRAAPPENSDYTDW